MRIIARNTLRRFWELPGRGDAEQPLKAWFREASHAQWVTPAAVKTNFRNASVIRGSRVIFNIAGNKYRLVVKINYSYQIIFIRFIGTHKDYDGIDVEEV